MIALNSTLACSVGNKLHLRKIRVRDRDAKILIVFRQTRNAPMPAGIGLRGLVGQIHFAVRIGIETVVLQPHLRPGHRFARRIQHQALNRGDTSFQPIGNRVRNAAFLPVTAAAQIARLAHFNRRKTRPPNRIFHQRHAVGRNQNRISDHVFVVNVQGGINIRAGDGCAGFLVHHMHLQNAVKIEARLQWHGRGRCPVWIAFGHRGRHQCIGCAGAGGNEVHAVHRLVRKRIAQHALEQSPRALVNARAAPDDFCVRVGDDFLLLRQQFGPVNDLKIVADGKVVMGAVRVMQAEDGNRAAIILPPLHCVNQVQFVKFPADFDSQNFVPPDVVAVGGAFAIKVDLPVHIKRQAVNDFPPKIPFIAVVGAVWPPKYLAVKRLQIENAGQRLAGGSDIRAASIFAFLRVRQAAGGDDRHREPQRPSPPRREPPAKEPLRQPPHQNQRAGRHRSVARRGQKLSCVYCFHDFLPGLLTVVIRSKTPRVVEIVKRPF